MIKLNGILSFDKATKLWGISLDCLGVHTQGRTRDEAFEMLKEATEMTLDVEDIIDGFDSKKGEKSFTAHLNPHPAIFSRTLIIARRRSGKTLKQVSDELGYKSHDTFAKYEKGQKVPSALKFVELLKPFGGNISISA